MDSGLKIIGKIETREKVVRDRFHVPKILGGIPGQHDPFHCGQSIKDAPH